MISREYPPSTSGASIAMYSYIKPIESYKFFITSYFKPKKAERNFVVKRIQERFKHYRYISAFHFALMTLLSSFQNFDCIIGNAFIGSAIGSMMKIFRRKPLISMVYDVDSLQKGVSSFGPLTRLMRTLAYKAIFKYSDVVIVSSSLVKEDIVKILGEEAGKKVKVLPIGVEIEPFKKIEKPKGKKIVLTIGGIMEKRGLEYMINGFKTVVETVKNAELWIIGPVIEKEYYEKIKALVEELGLEKNVKFIGRVLHSKKPINVFSYYDVCDVFAISNYHSTGYSLTCIEANLMGKPVVATNIIKDVGVVDDKKTAIIVPIKDSDSIGKAITKLLKDDKLRKEMGEAGKSYGKRFSVLEISKKYESIIQNTIKDAQ